MKILMVSIFSHHFFNWTLQLKDTNHEVYWLDLSDSDKKVEKIDFVTQFVNWNKKTKFPGRYYLKKHIPGIVKLIDKYNHRDLNTMLSRKIEEINPDAIQSFEMHSGCVSILEVMKSHSNIKWIYSCWGNDIYFYLDHFVKSKRMRETLPHVDYMFADCERDFSLAKKIGFKGKTLGPLPGGGGYDIPSLYPLIQPLDQRNIILVKGYQHRFGRCNKVLEALLKIKNEVTDYEIVVFGATPEVFEFVNSNTEFKELKNLIIKGRIGHGEILELMGASKIYIGNNISDGMPNTLLEAIIMEAFPIQSNPGGATEEILEDGVNGLLINEPENIEHIKSVIKRAISDDGLRRSGIIYNKLNIRPQLGRKLVRKKIISAYKLIEETDK